MQGGAQQLVEEFARIMMNARDAVGLYAPDGRAFYVNKAAQAFVGDEPRADPFRIVHSDDRDRVRHLFMEVVRTAASDRFQARILARDGTLHLMDLEMSPVTDVAGAVMAVLGIGRDVTTGLRDKAALQGVVRTLFDQAPIGIAITDEEGRYLRANKWFVDMLGYTESEILQLTGWDVIHPHDRESSRKLRDELFCGARKDFTWERRYIRKDGSTIWVQNTVAIMHGVDGSSKYAIALIEDVTRRRLSDAAIHATAERLQSLSRRLVELQELERRDIARELHDRVGQTLTAMRINMDMIRTRLATHDDSEIRKRNDDSIELMESTFKAVENVMYELRPPLLEEYGVVASLKWHARQFTERTGIAVEVRGNEPFRCPPDVELAGYRIAQEALTNVARHSSAKHVVIDVTRRPDAAVLAIEDDGVGFDAAQSRDSSGYGMIAMRERAEAVGGALEIQSRKGQGTRIVVTMPKQQ